MRLPSWLFKILLSLIFPLFALAMEKPAPEQFLGKITFTTSASKAAQAYFERGVLLLHSFEYERARLAFQQAEKADAKFALAYWGEAMTYNHPLWNEQDFMAAKKVLAKLGSTENKRIQKAKTPQEKGLLNAVNILYGAGSKAERDQAYADFMGELSRKYPNDDEIAAFYALALLGKTQGQRDWPSYMQAAAICEGILQHNPEHPGALHYVIHSYDDPVHAPLGLRAARRYGKIAAGASHALHMPSHIYLALGLWNDVVDSNKAAWEASSTHNPTGDPKKYTIHDFHALQWLSYGYLQKRQFQEALKLVKAMKHIAEVSNMPMGKAHYVLMRAEYITNSEDFNAELTPLKISELGPAFRAIDIYTNALIALNQDSKRVDATPYLAELEKIITTNADSVGKNGAHENHFTSTNPTFIKIAKIIALELRAQIEIHKGKLAEAIKLLREAVQLEDQLGVGYGPPSVVKPSRELLADVLLLNKQYLEAYGEYVNEFERNPNRANIVQGLKKSEDKIKQNKLPMPKGINTYFNKLM